MLVVSLSIRCQHLRDFSAMTNYENIDKHCKVCKLNHLECRIRKMNLHVFVDRVLKVSCSIIVLAYLIDFTNQDLGWMLHC